MNVTLQMNTGIQTGSIWGRSTVAQSAAATVFGKTDRLSLSRQAVAYLEESGQTSETEGSDELDAAMNSLKEMEKCQKIAASIMKGKRVPMKDEFYLMEHDLKAYRLALALQEPEKDDKVEKSVLDDEDDQGTESAEAAVSESGGTQEDL